MAEISRQEFLRDYGKALIDGSAAIFAGAGLSRASGFVDWRGLLREIAADLKLEIDRESDLVAVAQYHANERRSRAKLNEVLLDQFTRDARSTVNHSLIARLPVPAIWTTNYDTLIEDALRREHKRVDVKIGPETLAINKRGTDAVVFKMHGDVSAADEAVLTKEDYETYALKRELFSIRLKSDLVSRTFLFLGFSFTDPNIEYVLSRIRGLLGQNTPTHYCILRRPPRPNSDGAGLAEWEYEKRKLDLRIGDLQRYGIQTVLIEEYSEITSILQELNRRAFLNNIFVSGSAAEGRPGFDLARLRGFSRLLGREIIARDRNLVSGYGWEVGSEAVVGALEAAYENFSALHDRLILRPFPRTVEESRKVEIYRDWRKAMLARSGISVFIAGNRRDRTSNEIMPASGVRDEFEIGTTDPLHNYPIPVGTTGYVAREIWEQVVRDQARYYGPLDVRAPLGALGDDGISDEGIIEAIFDIVDRLGRARGD